MCRAITAAIVLPPLGFTHHSDNFVAVIDECCDMGIWVAFLGAKNVYFHFGGLRAFSYAVGFVSRKRPFSTEARVGLSYAVEKVLFRPNFFRLSFPTRESSRKT